MSKKSLVERLFKASLFTIANTGYSSNAHYPVNGKQTVLCYCHGIQLSNERGMVSALLNNG